MAHIRWIADADVEATLFGEDLAKAYVPHKEGRRLAGGQLHAGFDQFLAAVLQCLDPRPPTDLSLLFRPAPALGGDSFQAQFWLSANRLAPQDVHLPLGFVNAFVEELHQELLFFPLDVIRLAQASPAEKVSLLLG